MRKGGYCLILFLLLSRMATAQVLPGPEPDQLIDSERARIEALTILGADFGLTGGDFRSTSQHVAGIPEDTAISVNKFGGAGDVGAPHPLGTLPVGWQPVVQGSMGWLNSTNHLEAGAIAGDTSRFSAYAIQFGGGARFWLSDALSVSPTLMGMYGRISNTYDPYSFYARQNLNTLEGLGLIDWAVDTWTVRPALDLQYLLVLDRTVITLTSDGAFFDTQSFSGSNRHLSVLGTSGSLENKLDIDLPLGFELFGHELRTGGYLSRTDLYGGLRSGLGVDYINEVHARVVLDFLGQLWKIQWIGIGGSYLSGTAIRGWTIGADVMFRF